MLITPCHSSGDFSPPRRGFEPRSGHVEFLFDEVAFGRVFSEFSAFSCQLSFHRQLDTHHLSSWAGTISQLVTQVSPHHKKLKKSYVNCILKSRCILHNRRGRFLTASRSVSVPYWIPSHIYVPRDLESAASFSEQSQSI
jgi:hypothetical protein